MALYYAFLVEHIITICLEAFCFLTCLLASYFLLQAFLWFTFLLLALLLSCFLSSKNSWNLLVTFLHYWLHIFRHFWSVHCCDLLLYNHCFFGFTHACNFLSSFLLPRFLEFLVVCSRIFYFFGLFLPSLHMLACTLGKHCWNMLALLLPFYCFTWLLSCYLCYKHILAIRLLAFFPCQTLTFRPLVAGFLANCLLAFPHYYFHAGFKSPGFPFCFLHWLLTCERPFPRKI